MKHELKTWPEFFKHLWSGEKTFELRKDDRGFRAGDILHLREWSKTDGYTGRSLVATATYVLSGIGLRDNYVVIALSHLTSRSSGQAKCCDFPDITWNHDHTKSVCVFCGSKSPAA